MALIYFVFCAFRKCLDFICLLLDLNFWIFGSVIRLLTALMMFVHNMPTLIVSSAAGCWNLTLFCVLKVAEGFTSATHGTLHIGWLQVPGGVSEGFKMLGHLASHVLLRTRELLHRGLLSGLSLLRQAWEGCGIALSLVLYLVNTVVNVLLIGTQNCLSAVWEAVSGPLQDALELALAALALLHSGLVGTLVLALELLGSLGHVLATVFLLDLYGLLLAAAVLTVATVCLNRHGLLRPFCGTATLRRLQRSLYRMYLLALEHAGVSRGVGEGDGWDQRPAVVQPPEELAGREPLPATDFSREPSMELPHWGEDHKGAPAASLLTLLKEHEERKKCVICQDCAKTVLLLPCRHLCLCRACADILLRQPPPQHFCPLCRHAILHAMDVYL